MMSEQLKEKLIRVFHDAYCKGELDDLDEICAQDFLRHNPPYPDIVGLDAFKEYIVETRRTYPDFQTKIHESLIVGDVLLSRWSFSGTYSGPSESMEMGPTGKRVEVLGCSWGYIKDGKVTEEWHYGDFLGMLQQLGIIPQMT